MDESLKKKLKVGAGATGGGAALLFAMHLLSGKVDLIEARSQTQKMDMIVLVESKFNEVTNQLAGVAKTQDEMSKRLEVIDQRLYELKKNIISLDEPENKPSKL